MINEISFAKYHSVLFPMLSFYIWSDDASYVNKLLVDIMWKKFVKG